MSFLLIPAFLPSCLPAFLPSCLPSFLHSLPPSLPPSFLPACLPSFLYFYMRVRLPLCLNATGRVGKGVALFRRSRRFTRVLLPCMLPEELGVRFFFRSIRQLRFTCSVGVSLFKRSRRFAGFGTLCPALNTSQEPPFLVDAHMYFSVVLHFVCFSVSCLR